MDYDSKNLEGWAISIPVFEWIYNNIPHRSTILELGSGNGTKELCKHYRVYSIEENKKWADNSPSKCFFAPIADFSGKIRHSSGWYNESVLDKIPKKYDLFIIDGPVGNNRLNFMQYHEYFYMDCPIIVDDLHKGPSFVKMAETLASIYNKKIIKLGGIEKESAVLINV